MKKNFLLLFFPALFWVNMNVCGEEIISTNLRFDSLKVKAQRLVNTPDEILYLDSMLQLAEQMDSTRLQCQTMSFMARNYYNRMIPDSLMYWANKLDTLSLEKKYYSIFFDTFSLVCFWELYDKNYDIALDKANSLYQLAKDLDNSNGMIASYETIGLIYMETFRYVEAIKSYKEGLELQRQQKNPRYAYQFQFMSYIIEAYLKLKDYKGTKDALSEAYQLIEKCELEEEYFPIKRCLWLLCCYNIEMYVAQKMPQKAEAYIIDAEKYNDVDDFYVYCYYNLVSASYYQLLGQYEKALDNVNLVLAQTGDDYLPALKMKAELLLNAGMEQDAALLYHKSINLIDSTYNESLSKQINQLRTIHEVDKLELRNKHFELEAGRYKLTIAFILLFVLLLALFVIGFHYIRVKRIKNLLEISDKELKKDKEKLLLSEKELTLAKEKAEVSNHFKDVFIANLSHEIRTPLNSIVGFSNLLINMQREDEKKEYASIIKKNSDLLLKLVNDTVSVSLLQAGEIPLALENVNVKKICQQLADEYESKLAFGVSLKIILPESDVYIKTDTMCLRQVLDNLLSNAVKFTTKGEIVLKLELLENDCLARFIVEDTGIGIPKDIQGRIFDSFEKSDSFTQGIGLGLTICKFIAHRLNGAIRLDTSYKNGTRMIFTHPIILELQ
jgi:signal transduction histidine kinase